MTIRPNDGFGVSVHVDDDIHVDGDNVYVAHTYPFSKIL